MFVTYSIRICFHFFERLSPSSDNTISLRRLEAKEGTLLNLGISIGAHLHSHLHPEPSLAICGWMRSRPFWKTAQHSHCDCAKPFWIKAPGTIYFDAQLFVFRNLRAVLIRQRKHPLAQHNPLRTDFISLSAEQPNLVIRLFLFSRRLSPPRGNSASLV